MAEYIEREKLLELYSLDDPVMNEQGSVSLPVIRQNILDIPAADVSPVRHGHLSSTGYDELYCEFGNCSVCQKDNPIYSRYCWFCGAKMDVEVAGNDS